MSLLDRYQQAVYDLLFKARSTQREAVRKAGEIVADAVTHGRHVYLHRICHSIEMDLYERGIQTCLCAHQILLVLQSLTGQLYSLCICDLTNSQCCS